MFVILHLQEVRIKNGKFHQFLKDRSLFKAMLGQKE
jgi:hypothetical protein